MRRLASPCQWDHDQTNCCVVQETSKDILDPNARGRDVQMQDVLSTSAQHYDMAVCPHRLACRSVTFTTKLCGTKTKHKQTTHMVRAQELRLGGFCSEYAGFFGARLGNMARDVACPREHWLADVNAGKDFSDVIDRVGNQGSCVRSGQW